MNLQNVLRRMWISSEIKNMILSRLRLMQLLGQMLPNKFSLYVFAFGQM